MKGEEFKQKKVMYEQPFKPKRINDFNNADLFWEMV